MPRLFPILLLLTAALPGCKPTTVQTAETAIIATP